MAGTGKPGRGGDGGRAVEAQLSFPTGIAVDKCRQPLYRRFLQPPHPQGGHYGNHHDRSGDRGAELRRGWRDWQSRAQLSFPSGVAADHAGNLYISDPGNNRIRRVDADGTIATIAGNRRAGLRFSWSRRSRRSWTNPVAW